MARSSLQVIEVEAGKEDSMRLNARNPVAGGSMVKKSVSLVAQLSIMNITEYLQLLSIPK